MWEWKEFFHSNPNVNFSVCDNLAFKPLGLPRAPAATYKK